MSQVTGFTAKISMGNGMQVTLTVTVSVTVSVPVPVTVPCDSSSYSMVFAENLVGLGFL